MLSNCVHIALFHFPHFACPSGVLRSFVLPVVKCGSQPTRSQCTVSLVSASLFRLSSLSVSPTLLPSHQATSVAAAWFLFSSSVLVFVVSALPTISSLFRPLAIYSHFLLLSFCLFFNLFSVTLTSLIFLLSLLLSSPVFHCIFLFFVVLFCPSFFFIFFSYLPFLFSASQDPKLMYDLKTKAL